MNETFVSHRQDQREHVCVCVPAISKGEKVSAVSYDKKKLEYVFRFHISAAQACEEKQHIWCQEKKTTIRLFLVFCQILCRLTVGL